MDYKVRKIEVDGDYDDAMPYAELVDWMAARYKPLASNEFTVRKLVDDIREKHGVKVGYEQLRQILYKLELDGVLTSSKRIFNGRSTIAYAITDVEKFRARLLEIFDDTTDEE